MPPACHPAAQCALPRRAIMRPATFSAPLREPSDSALLAWSTTEDGALATLWGNYKANHDPPGMDVVGGGMLGYVVMDIPGLCLGQDDRFQARAAAWAWHDRRHGLVRRLEKTCEAKHLRALVPLLHAKSSLWSRCLAWSDEQVAEVERWLNDSAAEMPEVLRG